MGKVRIMSKNKIEFNGKLFAICEEKVSKNGCGALVLREIPKHSIRPDAVDAMMFGMGKTTTGIFLDECGKFSENMLFGLKNENKLIDMLINGRWMDEPIKSKTRYLTFDFKGREIYLAGRNVGDEISVGYSVYCNHILDKNSPKTPKNAGLSKKIALGRLDKNPIYKVKVSDSTSFFIDSALQVVKSKIKNEELVIKGIR